MFTSPSPLFCTVSLLILMSSVSFANLMISSDTHPMFFVFCLVMKLWVTICSFNIVANQTYFLIYITIYSHRISCLPSSSQAPLVEIFLFLACFLIMYVILTNLNKSLRSWSSWLYVMWKILFIVVKKIILITSSFNCMQYMHAGPLQIYVGKILW